MERSSGSIMDNVAEGFGRGGNSKFKNFLSYSRGSCAELKSQLYRARDLNLIQEVDFATLSAKCEWEIAKIDSLNDFFKYLGRESSKLKVLN